MKFSLNLKMDPGSKSGMTNVEDITSSCIANFQKKSDSYPVIPDTDPGSSGCPDKDHKSSSRLNQITKQLATAIVNVGRLQLGFWEAPVCLFEETCTRYSRRQVQKHILPLAVIKIFWRVMCCNPINGIIRRMRSK
jgi:putative component of membrane protein insertase Oxa1/YidC/SpoIIIJ protein YidD